MATYLAINWLVLLLAALLGLATAWWIWGAAPPAWDGDAGDDDAGDAAAEAEAGSGTETPSPLPTATGAAPEATSETAPEPRKPRRRKPVKLPPDNLELIKGIGPKLHEILNRLGIHRFDQIAAWTAQDIAELSPYLDGFIDRVERDDWIGQARLLSQASQMAADSIYGAH